MPGQAQTCPKVVEFFRWRMRSRANWMNSARVIPASANFRYQDFVKIAAHALELAEERISSMVAHHRSLQSCASLQLLTRVKSSTTAS